MNNIIKVRNCFSFKINDKNYLVNFKKRKFWVYSDEIHPICNNDYFVSQNLYERLIYEDLIEENQVRKDKNVEYHPILGTFLMSTICNLDCTYCYAYNNNNILLDLSKAKAAIDFLINNALLRKSKNIVIKFHGVGEPTINWEVLVESYKYAKNKTDDLNLELKVGITTNGVFPQEKRKWLAKNMNQITISMDGFENIQNQQRPHKFLNSYAEVIETIKALNKNSMTIRTTVTNLNVDHLPEWTKFLNNMGVKRVNYEPVMICGKGKESGVKVINKNLFVERYIEAKKIGTKLGIDVSYSGIKLDRVCEFHCGAYGNNFVITPQGNISTCYEVVEKNNTILDKFLIGEYEQEKINISYDSVDKLRQFARIKRNECNECFAQYNCSGGCISKRSLNFDEEITNSVKTKCEITKEILYLEFISVINEKEYLKDRVYSF